MAYINVFKVSQDGTELTLTMTPNSGYNLISIKLWTEDTFKDYSQALDFTSLLADTLGGQTVTITAALIDETFLDGIYFVEVSDNGPSRGPCEGCSNTVLGVATDFSRFNYCLMEYLCKIDPQCTACDNYLHKALTMKMYIDGLRNSLQLGNFTTAISFWENLDRACSASCTECGTTLSDLARKGLGFQTLGGELILY